MGLLPVEYLIGYMYIVERDRGSGQLVNAFMTAAGFSDDEIGNARSDARRAGLTRDSGIGERLSSVGRAEAPTFAAQLEQQREIDEPDPPPFAFGLSIGALSDRFTASIPVFVSEIWCDVHCFVVDSASIANVRQHLVPDCEETVAMWGREQRFGTFSQTSPP